MKLFPIVILLLLAPLSNYACKCAERSIEESVKDASVVFTGKVISRTEVASTDSLNPYHLYRYQVKKLKVYRGKTTSRTITIYSGMGGGDCGYSFKIGKTYVIYGSAGQVIDELKAHNTYSTNMCSGTRPYSASYTKELQKVTQGPPK